MNIVSSGAAALLLAVSCAVTPAFAMPGAGDGAAARVSDPAERFRQMDADHDGKLTWEELSAARPNLSRNAFDIIDADHNGGISLEEWQSFSSGHGGSAVMPDMSKMMEGMRGAGDRASMPATGTGMPLVMPPAQKDAGAAQAPAAGKAMPLITPPAEAK